MKSPDIIDAIEGIRKNNNSLWMEILRIASRYAPTETAEVFEQICFNDNCINKMSRDLTAALRREAIDGHEPHR